MHEPTEEDVAALQETLGLVDENARRLHEPPRSASVADEGERMHVTLYAASGNGSAPALIPVECVLGPNWIITAHREKIEVLDEFFERAQGEVKSAPSTHPPSSQRFSTGSLAATSAPWTLSRASWRSWTRRS
jgi:Mg2+ and Co2+ transporter CorA